MKGQHTTIQVDNGIVVDVDIKGFNEIYDDCLAGFFWFRNKHIASEMVFALDKNDVRGEVLIDHLIKKLSHGQNKPKCIKLKSYIHVGTPDEYDEYVYWTERAKPLITNNVLEV